MSVVLLLPPESSARMNKAWMNENCKKQPATTREPTLAELFGEEEEEMPNKRQKAT